MAEQRSAGGGFDFATQASRSLSLAGATGRGFQDWVYLHGWHAGGHAGHWVVQRAWGCAVLGVSEARWRYTAFAYGASCEVSGGFAGGEDDGVVAQAGGPDPADGGRAQGDGACGGAGGGVDADGAGGGCGRRQLAANSVVGCGRCGGCGSKFVFDGARDIALEFEQS